MTPEQKDLYARICEFELDDPSAVFPFSAKLAWEYQWTAIYTYRAIQEYKKFMLLAAIADEELSPSTVVDRVWHLHLLYTRSYWDEFCGKVLNKSLHHFPGLGGVEEGLKYYHQYCRTLEIYQNYFGTPPADIWNQPKFKSEGALFQWIDRRRCWIISKPNSVLVCQKLFKGGEARLWRKASGVSPNTGG
ncbi:MAG: glycine-rich domain-containing protein [Elainellaceae cyanobacterium]